MYATTTTTTATTTTAYYYRYYYLLLLLLPTTTTTAAIGSWSKQSIKHITKLLLLLYGEFVSILLLLDYFSHDICDWFTKKVDNNNNINNNGNNV